MSKNPALDARCAYALYKVLGAEVAESERQKALKLAKECGYRAHPDTAVSPLLANEQELHKAFESGWDQRAEEVRPRTDAELKETIDRMDKDAMHGCGQFYELYEQRFNGYVEDWLERLSEDERQRALVLLKPTAYNPEPTGHWTYDVEENDITFHPSEGREGDGELDGEDDR